MADTKASVTHTDDRDSISLEKEAGVAVAAYRPGLSAEDAEWLDNIPLQEQRRIFHKVDRRLVPMLALLYLIAHLDRANIGNAKIEGLEASLGMTGTDYNIVVAIFCEYQQSSKKLHSQLIFVSLVIPYILCEVPSNLVLAKFSRPSWYMGTLVTCWGIVMTLTGVVKSFGGLIATRFLLGVFEYATTRRTSNEGIASVVVGGATFFLLPDRPSTAKWLQPDEAKFLELSHLATRGLKRRNDDGETARKLSRWSVLKMVVGDYHLWLQSLVFMSNAVPNYGLKFTM
ncbi:hypothetical protein LTR10_007970 [Elasticomyces elasticus]|nr:hypothetical protein LTR10_007970 [Elasticomyces elasticus]KAK4970969.1 hypothetical protein LTR42_007946 [Elasticomyces elasticus]